MMRLAEIATRVPRWALFAVAGLVQVSLVAAMVVDRASILREGTEVTLQARPVDPRDLLRGDYVVLAYAMSSLPAGELRDRAASSRAPDVFVRLVPNAEGLYEAASVHAEPFTAAPSERMIRGRVASGATCGGRSLVFCAQLNIKYGIESYFVPQGEGREIEQARNQGKVSVVAAVTPSGRAAIKRLLIDGKPVYDEPLF
jgi:uncharacterized membrane-anchored protein